MATMLRGNNFYYDASLNTLGTLVKTKPAGYRNVYVRVVACPLGVVGVGEGIELDVVIGGHKLNGPTDVPYYRQARKFLPGDDDARLYVFTYVFRGWDPEEQIMSIFLERRNDASDAGTPAPIGLLVVRVSMVSF